jgi:HTH-type transcriptional regulator/antitoxin HigA
VAFRQTRVRNARDEAVSAWVREAELIAQQITLADFNADDLWGSLNELRRLTRKEPDDALTQAQDICARCGVALVVVPQLPGTRISGCARWLSDRHALVGLTIRYKWGDQLWFTFFHELAHILLHRDQRSFVVDNAVGDMGDGVVDPSMAKYEAEADRFAADTLIAPTELTKLPLHNPAALTNELIQDFASSLGIHPGIVIGRLQHDKILEQWQGNRLKQKLGLDFKEV